MPHKTFGIGRFSPLILLAVLVTGCATAPAPVIVSEEEAVEAEYEPDTTRVARAGMAEAQGNIVIAAREYRALAELSPPPWREYFWLKTANVLARGGYIDEAEFITKELAKQPLPTEQLIALNIINARIALMRDEPNTALEILSFADPVEVQRETLLELHHLRAEAYEGTNNYLESARERIIADSLIIDPEQKLQNHKNLWQTLNALGAEALQAFITEPPPDVLSGWLELAYTVKSAIADPAELQAQLGLWYSRYPEHPATGEFFDTLLANKDELIGRPEQIAVLLPLSGNFAAPATAVRDGFMAAYYARKDPDYQPDIRIYDTGGDMEQGVQVYYRALEEGADFIVGPLDKNIVDRLVQEENIVTPTLALNYAQTENQHNKLFQFGLLPEDEARQVAERAWLDGHNNAVVLIPQGEWGERMGDTFATHWEQLSGMVLETQTYDPGKNDFANPVKALLNIDGSKERYNNLKLLLGNEIEFEPRRRQDVDFIFVGAFPRQARQIRPQLKFFYASDLPLYSTSHSYSGVENVTLDRDMDGVMFCDMPWVLAPHEDSSPNWNEIEAEWKSTAHAFKRLYAMGADAYQLIPWLRYLRNHREEHFTGETGNLYLDNSNRIHRQLIWARFHRGKPKLDTNNDRYAQPF